MAAQYIPPAGLLFRLLGSVSNEVLYARPDQSPEVGGTEVDHEAEDQFFSLIHENSGATHVIKSKSTGFVLYARRNTEPKIGLVLGDGQYQDNHFIFQPGEGAHAKQFLLVVPSQNLRLYSRTTQSPFVGTVNADGFIYQDNYFSFLFEPVEFEKIEYNLNHGRIVSSNKIILANQTATNSQHQEQELSFALDQSETQTSKFGYSDGFPLQVGLGVKGGVPCVSGGLSLKLDVADTRVWIWGEDNSFSKKYSVKLSVSANPGDTIRVVSTINKGTIEVPYTICLKSKSGVNVETKGTWTGAATWDLRHEILTL